MVDGFIQAHLQRPKPTRGPRERMQEEIQWISPTFLWQEPPVVKLVQQVLLQGEEAEPHQFPLH